MDKQRDIADLKTESSGVITLVLGGPAGRWIAWQTAPQVSRVTLPCASENEEGSKGGAEIGHWWKAGLGSKPNRAGSRPSSPTLTCPLEADWEPEGDGGGWSAGTWGCAPVGQGAP